LSDRAGPPGFARRVPKAEIHLHLEGSVELETLARIAGQGGEGPGATSRARLAGLYKHRDFAGFLQNFRGVCAVIRRPGDFASITEALSRRLQDENVRYAEVFCSPAVFERAHGMSAAEILDAACGAARRREKEGGPRVRFLLDGVRQFGVPAMEAMVETAAACRKYDVIGIGMGGDERSAATAAFAGPYREARRLGLRTTVHAGEFDGPRSVWQAIEVLETERIGHGVRSVEDPELVRLLGRLGVPLECCPTSNVRTGVVPGWERHPIPALHRSGVAVTVSSDDPAMFGTTLSGEWEVLLTRLGLGPEEVMAIGRRTARATFQPRAEQEALVDEMRRAAAREGIVA